MFIPSKGYDSGLLKETPLPGTNCPVVGNVLDTMFESLIHCPKSCIIVRPTALYGF